MSEHTPEPWRIDDDEDAFTGGIHICGDAEDSTNGAGICGMWPDGGELSIAEQKSNAKRIVACVNACADKTDKDLQGKLFTEQELACAVELARRDAAKQQNAELLTQLVAAQKKAQHVSDLMAALEFLIDVQDVPEASCSCHTNPPCSDCVEYGSLREAVANAKTIYAGVLEQQNAAADFADKIFDGSAAALWANYCELKQVRDELEKKLSHYETIRDRVAKEDLAGTLSDDASIYIGMMENHSVQYRNTISELHGMVETLCNGLAWNIESHPTIMNESDAEALVEARALLLRVKV